MSTRAEVAEVAEVEVPAQSAAGAVLTDLIIMTFRVNAKLLEAAEHMARAGGLTAARWQAIGGALDEPRPVAEIARRMGLTRQSVQRLADTLVADGFATWEPNPRHRRAKLLAPTPGTYTAIRRIAAVQHPWSSAVGAEVGHDELRRTLGTLERLLSVLDELPPERFGPAAGQGTTVGGGGT